MPQPGRAPLSGTTPGGDRLSAAFSYVTAWPRENDHQPRDQQRDDEDQPSAKREHHEHRINHGRHAPRFSVAYHMKLAPLAGGVLHGLLRHDSVAAFADQGKQSPRIRQLAPAAPCERDDANDDQGDHQRDHQRGHTHQDDARSNQAHSVLLTQRERSPRSPHTPLPTAGGSHGCAMA